MKDWIFKFEVPSILLHLFFISLHCFSLPPLPSLRLSSRRPPLPLRNRPPPTVHVPINGRHVLISGGSSGIGLALARRAAAAGARVSILARDATRLQDARETIRLATGVDATALSADVRDSAAVARALDEAGPVDVLICNHGVFVPAELERQDLAQVRFMVEVNLMGTFHLIKAALPGMKNRAKETGLPAAIALMSSQAGQVGIYGYTAYSASKFGLRGLAEALQHEAISDNIRVSLIFPPDTQTPGLAEEHKIRPEISKLIAGSSGEMKAEDVAHKALAGITSGQFIIPCNFEGTMLAIATAGLSPQEFIHHGICGSTCCQFHETFSIMFPVELV